MKYDCRKWARYFAQYEDIDGVRKPTMDGYPSNKCECSQQNYPSTTSTLSSQAYLEKISMVI